MSLEQFAHFNNLSPEFRSKLEDKVRGFGKQVRYKFDIAKTNPDPEKYNGAIIYPNMYALSPAKFTLIDNSETRKEASKTKTIGLVKDTDEKGLPNKFEKIKVFASNKGVLTLNLENPEDFYKAMYLELHQVVS